MTKIASSLALVTFMVVLLIGVSASHSAINVEFFGYESLQNTTKNTTELLPSMIVTKDNLTTWGCMECWQKYYDYEMHIGMVNFSGNADNYTLTNGIITLIFDFEGICSSNSSIIWDMGIPTTIEISHDNVTSISFARQQFISQGDTKYFLNAWIQNVVVPYLKGPSRTSDIFPAANITGYDLNTWYQSDNNFSNYTGVGYFVAMYNLVPNLRKDENGVVSGLVGLTILAFGNDTNGTSCTSRENCQQITDVQFATIDIQGVRPGRNTSSPPYFSLPTFRISKSDILNFVRGYYENVFVPRLITYYYYSTINIPDFNWAQTNSNSHTDSDGGSNPTIKHYSVDFSVKVVYNMSLTNNSFYGNLITPYYVKYRQFQGNYRLGKTANITNFQGNVTLAISGQTTGLKPSGLQITNAILTPDWQMSDDRLNFVQDDLLTFFIDGYIEIIQDYVNNYLSNCQTC